jgi:hypothetical protein
MQYLKSNWRRCKRNRGEVVFTFPVSKAHPSVAPMYNPHQHSPFLSAWHTSRHSRNTRPAVCSPAGVATPTTMYYVTCILASQYSDQAKSWTTREEVFFPTGTGVFLFSTVPRPVLGPTQRPIQWVPVALYPGVKAVGAIRRPITFT